MQGDIDEGLPKKIEDFVRLSKYGHFKQARQFFDAVLSPHLLIFTVAAEYTNCLLDQGDFRAVDDFLTEYTEYDLFLQDDEVRLLKLLLAFARIYTRGLLKEAVQEARDAGAGVGAFVGLTTYAANTVENDVQIHILVIRLRIFNFALKTSNYLDDPRNENLSVVLPVLTHDTYSRGIREVMKVDQIYQSLVHHRLWQAVYLPEIILSVSKTPFEGDIQQYVDTIISKNDYSDEATNLATITALDSWCEALLQGAWENPEYAVDTKMMQCIESCIETLGNLLTIHSVRFVDISPTRFQARLLLFQTDFQLWRRRFECRPHAIVLDNHLGGGQTPLLEALHLAIAAEDHKVQSQYLEWLLLEAKPSQWGSLMGQNVALWRGTRNTPFYLEVLTSYFILIKPLHAPESVGRTVRRCIRYHQADRGLFSSCLEDSDTRCLRYFAIPTITRSYWIAYHALGLHTVPSILPRYNNIGEDCALAHTTLGIPNGSSGILRRHASEWSSRMIDTSVYLWNTYSILRGALVTRPHRTSVVDLSQRIKASAVFELAADFLPPAAIVALKLTCRSNFEGVTSTIDQTFRDGCASSAIRRHLEESREAPLRYRCACCKALYPSHMFEQLATPFNHDGSQLMFGRICRWHSGRFARVVGQPDLEGSPEQISGMGPRVKNKQVVRLVTEQVCMHCGRVQAWEACECECETCWYKQVLCTTTYVGVKSEFTNRGGVAIV